MSKKGGARAWGLAVAAAVLGAGGAAGAATVSPAAGGFAVLAGGQLSTGSNVTVNGSAGAVGNVWFNDGSSVSGPVYAGGTFGTGTHVTVGDILGNSSVSLHAGNTAGAITGASIWTDKDTTINGSVQVSGSVSLTKTTVNGSVDYNGSYWATGNTTITGGKSGGTASVDTFSVTLPTAAGFNPGSSSLWYASGSTVSLAAGSYGSLSVSSGSTLNLTAGVYDFSSVYLASGVTIHADTSGGDVVIKSAGQFSTDAYQQILATGAGQLSIQSGGFTFIGNHSTVQGSIAAYNAQLSIDASSTVTGSVYASGDVWLGQGVTVQGLGAIGGASHLSAVPEPGSAGLAMVGGLVLVRRRRRGSAARRAAAFG